MARVIVITGPSGVGKGTLIRGLLQRVPELELSV
ncbi:MAG: Guanylate kinase, partial [Solirubrobacteraceae bacterium]|nr:Guanylate kinase [Solirubrobacteraceae bacterium]